MPVEYLQDGDTPDVMYSPEEEEYGYQRRLNRLREGAFGMFGGPSRRPMDEKPPEGALAPPPTETPDSDYDYIGAGGGLGEDVGPVYEPPPSQDSGYITAGGGLGEDVGPEERPESGRGGGGMGGTITPTPATGTGTAAAIAPAPHATPNGMPPGPDYAKWEAAIRQRPTMTPPKWWQRVGGAAAGFGAGWSNAAGRTRIPVDIGAMRENILHPGYAGKLSEWESRYIPTEAEAKLEAERQSQWWKNRTLQSEADYKAAAAEQARKHGAYWQHRAEMEQNQWKPVPGKPGWLANTITGETKQITQVGDLEQQRYNAAKRLNPNMDEDMAQYYALNGTLQGYGSTLANPVKPTTPKNLNITDILLHPNDFSPEQVRTANRLFDREHREPQGRGAGPTRAQAVAIEARRHSRDIAAEERAKKRIATGKEDDADIYRDLTTEKQQNQNDYESEIERAGGTAEHYEYPAMQQNKPAPATGGKAAPTGGGQQTQTFTEAEARAVAQRRGIDPDAFVKKARDKGLLR